MNIEAVLIPTHLSETAVGYRRGIRSALIERVSTRSQHCSYDPSHVSVGGYTRPEGTVKILRLIPAARYCTSLFALLCLSAVMLHLASFLISFLLCIHAA